MEKVSVYQNFKNKLEDKPLIDILEQIKNGDYKTQINKIRESNKEGKKDEVKTLKDNLIAFTTSATFNENRTAKDINTYSQYICLDYDKLSDISLEKATHKSKLAQYTYAAFVSPSGMGLKIIVKVNTGQEYHKDAYNQVADYYNRVFELQNDNSCSDISRLCFISYDHNCFINKNAEVFEIETEPFETEKNSLEELQDDILESRQEIMIESNKQDAQNLSTSEKLDKCLKFTEQKQNYHEGNRNNFIYLFASNANRFGINESDTLNFCIDQFDLSVKEIKNTVNSTYKNNSEDFAKFAKFANLAEYDKHFIKENDNINNNSVLSNTPIIPNKVYKTLPTLFQKGIEHIKGKREKDVFLTGALSIISGCLPEVKGLYHGKEVYPNLFSFVLAPAASGKGTLTFAKILADKYHDEIIALSKQMQEEYKQQLEAHKHAKKYLKKGEQLPPPPEEPPFKVVYIPANTSNAKIIKHLEDNDGFGIICETEADTLGQVFKNDWGSYSDLLRKAYHHEKISISRKTNNEYFEINNPRLAVVLSGTPNQILNIIDSAEDGLFSRFLFYVFSSEPKWLDPSPKSNPINLTEHFNSLSKDVNEMVKFLDNSPTYITLSDKQWERFNPLFDEYLFRIYNLVSEDATSIIKRLGLIVYRFCMIFTALRKYDHQMLDPNLECTDEDFNNAIALADIYLEHSLIVYNSLPNNTSEITFTKSSPVFDFYKELPKKFQRKEAVELGKKINISERTIDNHLSKLEKARYLSKPKAGYYIKVKK
ncbi:DUF3987 domain-containing protein [Psychroflexus sp. MBR-150]|jgi:hypothetical protein